jgi:hypothetical protein
MITICLTHFRSLTLANLAAALYSLRRQNLSGVKEVVIIDNDTLDTRHEIQVMVDALVFPVPVRVLSFKHGDASKTHAWSTNRAVQEVETPWILFTRADYILHQDLLQRVLSPVLTLECFVTANGYHLNGDVHACEQSAWRVAGAEVLRTLPGVEYDYGAIDTGVWMASRRAFDSVGGLDERLTAWGHAQTHFQHKLFTAGVNFIRIPEVLFYHPAHGGEKDINLAHQQLEIVGVGIKEMWARYHGASPY